MGVGKNGRQERMHGMDKMDTEGNPQEGNWKFGRRRDWGGLTRVAKIMDFEWGTSEMVVNSCLEDLEGRMRLKRM